MPASGLPNNSHLECNQSPFWTKPRLRLLGWLQQEAPAVADFFGGAVELAYGRSIPGWTRFVCHAIREIGNRLPDIILGPTARTKADATHAASSLAEAWIEEGYPKDGTLPGTVFTTDERLPADTTVSVSYRIAKIASEIARDYVLGCEFRRDAAELFFQALTPAGKDERAKLRTLADQWHKIMRWAVRATHASKDGSNDVDPDVCRKRFDEFQSILGSLIWDFFNIAGEIDEILEDANA